MAFGLACKPRFHRPSQSLTNPHKNLERAMRIELTWPAWKAGALPLSYARSAILLYLGTMDRGNPKAPFAEPTRTGLNQPKPTGTNPNAEE